MSLVSFKRALLLSERPYCGIVMVEDKRQITLGWGALGSAEQSVTNICRGSIGTYSKRLNGVPLAFGRMRLQKECRASGDVPCMHLDLVLQWAIFRPRVGQIYRGKVAATSGAHATVFLHGCISVAATVPNKFATDLQNGDWAWVRVDAIHAHGSVLNLTGKLIKSRPGAYQVSTNGAKSKYRTFFNGMKMNKEARHQLFDPMLILKEPKLQPTDTHLVFDSESDDEKTKKKKKKHKKDSGKGVSDQEILNEASGDKQKKKHKHKASELVNSRVEFSDIGDSDGKSKETKFVETHKDSVTEKEHFSDDLSSTGNTKKKRNIKSDFDDLKAVSNDASAVIDKKKDKHEKAEKKKRKHSESKSEHSDSDFRPKKKHKKEKR